MKKIFLLIILFFFFTKLQGQKILFVGNSLTYTNNMPSILKEIGKSFDKKIITKMICKPNYAIIDHLNEGIIQQEIASKEYDLVIIEQGPSSQKQGREMLINDGRKIAKVCSKNNTMLGYFMVWPSKQYYFTFNKVIKNHTEAAKKTMHYFFLLESIGSNMKNLKTKLLFIIKIYFIHQKLVVY